MQRTLVKEMMDRVFEGSAERLILRALDVARATPEELDQIRRLLDEAERKE